MSNFIIKCWSDATRWCIPDKHWWGDRWWCGAMIATRARLVPGKVATRCHEWPQRQGIALSHTLRNVAKSLPYTFRKNIYDISNTYKMQIVLILVSVLQTKKLRTPCPHSGIQDSPNNTRQLICLELYRLISKTFQRLPRVSAKTMCGTFKPIRVLSVVVYWRDT